MRRVGTDRYRFVDYVRWVRMRCARLRKRHLVGVNKIKMKMRVGQTSLDGTDGPGGDRRQTGGGWQQ